MAVEILNITTEKILSDLAVEKNIEVSVLRLDKIHPVISGNKWFKLRYYFEEARQQNKRTIVTFGGAWSNHIVATAAACRENKFDCIGIIRGEEPGIISPTLVQARELGMQLIFISREDYRVKKIPEQLNRNENYFIPEGGFGIKGAAGASIIFDFIKGSYSHICCAVGTGTMMTGLINKATSEEIVGISVMKNNFELEKNIRQLLNNKEKQINLVHDYHFGGYAKHSPELIAFMNDFYRQTNIPSDFVYTGKLFYAVKKLIENKFFPENSKMLLTHSGGLQGNASLNKGTLIF